MNINPNFSNDEKDIHDMGSIELTNTALNAIQDNIIDKVADQLELMDFVGFESVRVILEEVARKAEAYELMTSNKNQFQRN
jgi:hypothetical protein